MYNSTPHTYIQLIQQDIHCATLEGSILASLPTSALLTKIILKIHILGSINFKLLSATQTKLGRTTGSLQPQGTRGLAEFW